MVVMKGVRKNDMYALKSVVDTRSTSTAEKIVYSKIKL